MKIHKITPYWLIIGLALLFSCSNDEVSPDRAVVDASKLESSQQSLNPVIYFSALSTVDLEVPPPFPVMTPQGNKMKISTTFFAIVSSDCQLVNGYMTTNLEGLWDENMTGPVSGEFIIEREDGSHWEGQVHGKRHKIDESTWKWIGHYIGKGYGEAIDGSNLQFKEVIISHELMANVLESTLEGKIISPPTSTTTN